MVLEDARSPESTRPVEWHVPHSVVLPHDGAKSMAVNGWSVDLGAGQAPYDDGLPTNDSRYLEPGGFSDSLLQVSYEHPLGSWASLTSTASASRFQEEMLFEAVREADFAWFTIGLRIRF